MRDPLPPHGKDLINHQIKNNSLEATVGHRDSLHHEELPNPDNINPAVTVGQRDSLKHEVVENPNDEIVVQRESIKNEVVPNPNDEVVGQRETLKHKAVDNLNDEIVIQRHSLHQLPNEHHAIHPNNKHDANRVDYEAARDNIMFDNNNRALDLVLSVTVYTLVLLTFCCLFMYFKMLKKRSKTMKKRHP